MPVSAAAFVAAATAPQVEGHADGQPVPVPAASEIAVDPVAAQAPAEAPATAVPAPEAVDGATNGHAAKPDGDRQPDGVDRWMEQNAPAKTSTSHTTRKKRDPRKS